MNTREREVMDALAAALREADAMLEFSTAESRSALAAHDALLAERSASSEGAEAVVRIDVAKLYSLLLSIGTFADLKGINFEGRPISDAVAEAIGELSTCPPQPAQGEPGKKDREADRARFLDAAFNRWLDDGISDAGHTVYDTIGSVLDAWHGWQAREYYGPKSAQGEHEQRSCEGSERRPIARNVVSAIADEVVDAAVKIYHFAPGEAKHREQLRAVLEWYESAIPRGLPAGSYEQAGWQGRSHDPDEGWSEWRSIAEIDVPIWRRNLRNEVRQVFATIAATAEQPSCGQDARDAALFAFPGDAIAHVYRAKWDAERECYVSIDPPMVTHPLQQPVGHVRKHTGEFKDMAIIVWTNEQPPEGAALYLGPPTAAVEGDEPYPYRWRKPGGLWQYVRHPNREAFADVLRDLEECGFEVERTGSDDAAIAAQQRGTT